METEKEVYTFIDTPGLGDTNGVKQDEENIKRIIIGVQKVSNINAILYIHRASDCRADHYLKYYIDKLRSMLTKSFKDNFVICFTGVVNPMKIDAEETLRSLNILTGENYVFFENDCLTPPDQIKNVNKKKLEFYKRSSINFW